MLCFYTDSEVSDVLTTCKVGLCWSLGAVLVRCCCWCLQWLVWIQWGLATESPSA